ncbi:MAG: DUF1015 domain-containing protein [Candidatus Omnitrophica bacterium]|nr:DUF1015 domain-containing protein [Candidatus Omnitrophota bacterium]MDD5653468.1 DUF1015 domain-containing protein [Candidatus Omnitrophota bacterium]
MTKIAPFKAVVFNPQKVKDLAQVVCPPYDVISPARQDYFHGLNPHNFIHILLGKDIPGEDKYHRAAVLFREWQKEEVLAQDKQPAVYFYQQQYTIKGEKRSRLGFIALLRLEEKNSRVFGHEHTRTEPKEDRAKLIRQVKANLSPIFAIFADKKRLIRSVYQQYIERCEPFVDIVDQDNVRHRLWRIDSPEILGKIEEKMSDENIFIADGHHRYEVACGYRDEMKKKNANFTGEESFNYILTYFTNPHTPDLTIMPIHRLVNPLAGFYFEKFLASLSDYFDCEEVKDRVKFFFLLQKAGSTEHVIGMYRQKKFWLLRLKNIKILDKIIIDKQKEYRSLDVSIFNYLVLKKLMGMDIEDKQNIVFNHDTEEVLEGADRSSSAIAFFLNPVKMEQIMSVALSGEKMPSKSTFFYPKVLSGLVIHKF